MLVPWESLHSAWAVELAIDSAEKYTVGDPLDGVDPARADGQRRAQRDRVRGYIEKGGSPRARRWPPADPDVA